MWLAWGITWEPLQTTGYVVTTKNSQGLRLVSLQLFARGNPQACPPYSSRTYSWCDSGDEFCDSGDSLLTHFSYFDHEAAIVDFVINRYNKLKWTKHVTYW
jgi:hypothetical protein